MLGFVLGDRELEHYIERCVPETALVPIAGVPDQEYTANDLKAHKQ